MQRVWPENRRRRSSAPLSPSSSGVIEEIITTGIDEGAQRGKPAIGTGVSISSVSVGVQL
ncbi:MAG: hypothetical protein ACLR9W_00460 [Enterobacter hormaechei]